MPTVRREKLCGRRRRLARWPVDACRVSDDVQDGQPAADVPLSRRDRQLRVVDRHQPRRQRLLRPAAAAVHVAAAAARVGMRLHPRDAQQGHGAAGEEQPHRVVLRRPL